MVAGLEEITGGEIAIGGRVVNRLEPAERDIAMVFQNYALYPHMSVYDNMAYGLKIAKVSKAEIDQRVQKAAKILELSGLLERKPRQLSGGQRQRVAIARAIAPEPALLVADEPTSALDVSVQGQVINLLLELRRRRKLSILFITHNLSLILCVADRVGVMQAGRLIEVDSPDAITRRPAHAYTQALLSANPVLPDYATAPARSAANLT